jgi:pimeloyl-ACP methyl ester carboxylesterase
VPPRSKGTFVVFGGFDSYIEECFPFLSQMRDDAWTIVAIEGPGQGTALEESKTVLTPDWHRPIAAVLDAFGLDDFTLLGISLGGCLVVPAAAFEPLVRRVIAWGIMTDFYGCMTLTLPPPPRSPRDDATNAEAKSRLDLTVQHAAGKSPLLDWRGSRSSLVASSRHCGDAAMRKRILRAALTRSSCTSKAASSRWSSTGRAETIPR